MNKVMTDDVVSTTEQLAAYWEALAEKISHHPVNWVVADTLLRCADELRRVEEHKRKILMEGK